MATRIMFQLVAEELNKAFISDTRADGTKFYKLADDAPEWLQGSEFSLACHKALDDRFPDDWVYEQMYFLADYICQYETADAARDAMGEIADGMVDVYNTERTKWLAMHLNNADLCNEAARELGFEFRPDENGILELIGMGQYIAIERIGNAMIELIEQEANDRDDAVEYADKEETE